MSKPKPPSPHHLEIVRRYLRERVRGIKHDCEHRDALVLELNHVETTIHCARIARRERVNV